MSDLEWYLDVGGKQSGPHAAKEIVEMVRSGKIPATSQVTAARMNGDWVTAQDLISAYDELNVKPKAAAPMPIDAAAFTSSSSSSSGDSNFAAPPRPTEQLERSKIITLNREEHERTPDPTEALFQAIQAARDKANTKSTATASSSANPSSRDSFGAIARPAGPRIPPQLILILALAAIFGITVYGFTKLVGSKKSEETSQAPAPIQRRNEAPAAPRANPAAGGLLNDQGGGSSAARVAPPVQRVLPRRNEGMMPTRPMRNDAESGGARYRDDRDSDSQDVDIDESGMDMNRDIVDPNAIDPSQVPDNRMMNDPNGLPVRGGMPGQDPTQPPPGAAQ